MRWVLVARCQGNCDNLSYPGSHNLALGTCVHLWRSQIAGTFWVIPPAAQIAERGRPLIAQAATIKGAVMTR